MDTFSKFTDDELEVIDDLSTTDESIIEVKNVKPYDTSFLGNPCTKSEKTGVIFVGATGGVLFGIGVAFSMTKYHKSFMDGLRMCGKIFSIIP